MTDERRRAPRLESSARVLWRNAGDDFLQLDRVTDVSETGAAIHADAIARIGTIVYFELRDDDDRRIAEGTGRVVWVDPSRGMGIEFLNMTLDAAAVASNSIPPPLPGASAQSDAPAPQIEPLSVPTVSGVIIGIDLGTTNTCASWVVDGRPTIIPGRTGGNTIPSMINFDPDGRVHIGQRAADRQILHPERTVYGSKRLLGRTYQLDLALDFQAHFAFPLGEAEEQRFGVVVDDRVVSIDEVATRVLEEVRATAEDYLGVPVEAAVITVPAYFSEVQRDAVRRAARNANLTVHRIVNEPTAAAVAYGHRREEEARIAVWDFGGGTFDFSVVDIRHERYEVVATGGDNFVGGHDFDDLVASWVLEEFLREEGLDGIQVTATQIARLRESAEVAKRALSVQTEFDIRLPEMTREPRRDLHVTLTRERFDELTRPLVERTLAIAQGVLLSGGILPSEIDEVVLVGGTTRVPAVHEAVEALFERRASRRINPDEAVALGAALLAEEIGSDGPTLLDILPMTLGRAVAGRAFEPIIRRNERLPCDRVLTVDADLLGTVMVPLFQGESKDATDNEYLYTIVVQDDRLRDGRARISLSFDEHCLMAVSAQDARSGAPVEVTLDRERALDDILKDLGMYQGPAVEDDWQLPQTTIGKVFGKLFSLFRR